MKDELLYLLLALFAAGNEPDPKPDQDQTEQAEAIQYAEPAAEPAEEPLTKALALPRSDASEMPPVPPRG